MNDTKEKICVFWFRRDLRLEDNTALSEALQSGYAVLPIFIFDTNILQKLPATDARVSFIYEAIRNIHIRLAQIGTSLLVKIGKPLEIFREISNDFDIKMIYANHDYEKYAIERDTEISHFFKEKGITFSTFKDQVIFEKQEILNGAGKPYTVFTPYSKQWKLRLSEKDYLSRSTTDYFCKFLKINQLYFPSLNEIGFKSSEMSFPKNNLSDKILEEYAEKRDFPALNSTSKLGVHLRFGTISIRKLVKMSIETGAETFLNELIWRDFYFNITANFPHISDGHSFKKEYDNIIWRNDEEEFYKWCEGKTGYPIVDAGMRELNQTGFMHNRVRMITASFLTKHLLIDWRWGEAYFAEKLLDFDFSANNGGWQWAASCGCDAVPYFRIFNPTAQAEKFDNQQIYQKKWIPELHTSQYPEPIVEHTFARQRALNTYKNALK